MSKILIGLPMHKSEINCQTVESLMRGSSDVHDVQLYPLGLSLLAKNFNLIWIKAYTKDFDYIVIHHTDLGVVGFQPEIEGTWIDVLVDLMQESGAAAISSIVPIKSRDGLTSTGLEMERGNPHSLRRLTLAESQHLSHNRLIGRNDLCELFDVEEVRAGALLVNTGLMIIDLKNFPWAEARWPGFSIQDSIEWSKGGKPQSYTIPEDWGFSNWLHLMGWPYYAYRGIVTSHAGTELFLSNHYEQMRNIENTMGIDHILKTKVFGSEHDIFNNQPSIAEWKEQE